MKKNLTGFRHEKETENVDICPESVESGWTLLELVISLMVLTIGVIGFIMALVSSLRVSAAGHERDIAINAARQMIERIQSHEFSEIYALYNSNPSDDPGGSGTAPGPNFAVDGLRPRPGDVDGMEGQIIFPVSGGKLAEDVSMPEFGLPKDLNGDQVIDNDDRAGDYTVLPVAIRIEWLGTSSEWEIEIRALLVESF